MASLALVGLATLSIDRVSIDRVASGSARDLPDRQPVNRQR